MDIYYHANQVYQLSYAKPILLKLGGTVIVKRSRKIPKFELYLRKRKVLKEKLRKIPPVRVVARDPAALFNIRGILLSNANSLIRCDNSKCKMVFVYHGTGDKRYGGDPRRLALYDYHFVTGPKYIQKLRDVNVKIPEEKLLKVGNLRFDEYLNLVDKRDYLIKRYGIKDTSRKNVLYAPTWRWGNGTLKKYGKLFCRLLSKEFNLIVRPHYYDKNYALYLKSWVKLNKIEHVYFSDTSNIFIHDTMHDFVVSDILISDTSSVTYEYLISRKPIIIIDTGYDNLHNMPDDMNVAVHTDHFDGTQDIVSLVWKNLEDKNNYEKYNTLLFNCFYFNDGKSTERALNYIYEIYKEIE